MTTTIEQINGVRVRDFRIVNGAKRCQAACIDCGKERDVLVSNLERWLCQRCRPCYYKTGSRKTHGMADTSLYKRWQHMIDRCTNPNGTGYENYGGRGITVCKEWQDPVAFLEWAHAHGYDEGLMIDRIDNNGNYGPSNCRWVTRTVQNQNRRRQKSNTSGYIGVTRRGDGWSARISVNGTRHYLGLFDTASEAAHAYDNYVTKNDLEHTLNFPNHSFTGS